MWVVIAYVCLVPAPETRVLQDCIAREWRAETCEAARALVAAILAPDRVATVVGCARVGRP